MASKVDICNLALSHVGAYRIQSIDEPSKEARECKAHYETSLNTVLEGHDWSFARKRLNLALLTDTYTDWDYAYQYPTDCIVPRYLADSSGAYTGTSYDIDTDRYVPIGKVKYELASDSTLSNRILLTDVAQAELIYTAKVTDTNMFTYKFIEALSLKLAVYLVQPIKGDLDLKQSLFQFYGLALMNAKGTDGNSDENKTEDVNSFVSARG